MVPLLVCGQVDREERPDVDKVKILAESYAQVTFLVDFLLNWFLGFKIIPFELALLFYLPFFEYEKRPGSF